MSNEPFSVCRFFQDNSYEYVKRNVDVDEAVEAFSKCVGGCSRVIVMVGDSVNLEWTFRGGLDYPRKVV
jgi:hypothetical protein